MARKKRRNAGEGYISHGARKDGRYCGFLTIGWQNGRRLRKWFYGATAAEVRDRLLKARSELKAGLPVAPERQTVEQFLERWLKDAVAPSVRPLTLEQYQQHASLYLIPAFGKTLLPKLHPAEIQRFIADRLAGGLSPRTVRISLFVLRRACAQAVKWGVLGRNPVDAVDLPKLNQRPIKTFTQEQARALLAAVRGDSFEPAYLLALLCGLRRGELLALAWKDVDFEGSTLAVHRALERIGGRLEFVEPKATAAAA